MDGKKSTEILADLDKVLPELEALYKDVHAHPELSMQEKRTSGIAADHLRDSGFEVTTGVGKTGVVGILHNGDGPTVMLRADMDALPIKEVTSGDLESSTRGRNYLGRFSMFASVPPRINFCADSGTLQASNRDLY